MKKKILLFLLMFVALFTITGCGSGSNNEEQEETVTANTRVGYLNFYAPEDYNYNPELRGLIYSENERKIYSKGDVNDYSDVIFVDVYVDSFTGSLKEYVETVNNKLSDKDVKFTLKSNKSISELYAREDYTLTKNGVERVNYAYLVAQEKYIHAVSINGPKTKSDEVKTLARKIGSSLKFD